MRNVTGPRLSQRLLLTYERTVRIHAAGAPIWYQQLHSRLLQCLLVQNGPYPPTPLPPPRRAPGWSCMDAHFLSAGSWGVLERIGLLVAFAPWDPSHYIYPSWFFLRFNGPAHSVLIGAQCYGPLSLTALITHVRKNSAHTCSRRHNMVPATT